MRPVEEALATLSGIKEIEATARPDEAQFTVLFNWDRDAETAAFEVRTKLDSIRSSFPPRPTASGCSRSAPRTSR